MGEKRRRAGTDRQESYLAFSHLYMYTKLQLCDVAMKFAWYRRAHMHANHVLAGPWYDGRCGISASRKDAEREGSTWCCSGAQSYVGMDSQRRDILLGLKPVSVGYSYFIRSYILCVAY